jgi:hypothetical protein
VCCVLSPQPPQKTDHGRGCLLSLERHTAGSSRCTSSRHTSIRRTLSSSLCRGRSCFWSRSARGHQAAASGPAGSAANTRQSCLDPGIELRLGLLGLVARVLDRRDPEHDHPSQSIAGLPAAREMGSRHCPQRRVHVIGAGAGADGRVQPRRRSRGLSALASAQLLLYYRHQ